MVPQYSRGPSSGHEDGHRSHRQHYPEPVCPIEKVCNGLTFSPELPGPSFFSDYRDIPLKAPYVIFDFIVCVSTFIHSVKAKHQRPFEMDKLVSFVREETLS